MTIEGASALNRARWSSGGKEVAVGDSEGRVWIYDVGEVWMVQTTQRNHIGILYYLEEILNDCDYLDNLT